MNLTPFSSDYFRMTGSKLRFSFTTIINFLFQHNIRYMFWWRNAKSGKLKFLTKFQLYRYSRKFGLEISSAAQIGRGLYLGHPYNITVNSAAVLGENINLHKGVTIGAENRGQRRGAPHIGNCVFVGINATIVGNITIGNDVLIAPNAYVNFDVPDHSVVIGNPGKITHHVGATDGYICFKL